MNEIWLKGLRVSTWIGVPDVERESSQEVVIDVMIEPACGFDEMDDDIANTVDYASVAVRIEALAGAHPRRLIETLAAETAEMILREFHARSVTVEIRKFILPQTDHVAVRFRLSSDAFLNRETPAGGALDHRD